MNWFRYIGGVMFSVLALNVVDRVFELWSNQRLYNLYFLIFR